MWKMKEREGVITLNHPLKIKDQIKKVARLNLS